MANNYKNSKVDLTATTVTTLYTAPAATQAIVKSILVSNDTGSETTLTLTITDSASAVFSVYKLESIGALSTKELLIQPLIVMESEILKLTATSANALHVIASYLEVT
jgi:hypothetical protein|tara:strand:+ start:177 stop:500 length:324 start_codon:yes stop_codon:yes gene_type:complete